MKINHCAYLYIYVLFFILSACNQAKEASSTSLPQSQQDKSSPVIKPKITFDDIKDRFLHKDLQKVSFQDSLFYFQVTGEIDSSRKYFIYQEDLDDLGFLNLKRYKEYKPERKFLYSINHFNDGYLIGLAGGGEFFSHIDYIFCDKAGKPIFTAFNLGMGGDGGLRMYDFAFLGQDKIEVHNLSCELQSCKYYQYHLRPNKDRQILVADTLNSIQTRYEYDEKPERYLFSEILKKYGLWTENWGL